MLSLPKTRLSFIDVSSFHGIDCVSTDYIQKTIALLTPFAAETELRFYRQDSCSADGYTTSVYTLSISSATYDNHRPWYLEECPSSIATTYSSANINQPAIVHLRFLFFASSHSLHLIDCFSKVTVDVPAGCTKMHTAPTLHGEICNTLSCAQQTPLRFWEIQGGRKMVLEG
ncbi:unnamed protein product [Strongylus vulgaris]|uniref:Uncharacterized protein n=1 Tax=Strongylus vulgaris TaxID=40348 RepID=A0A3P7LPS4_STRVU|nr:unnamed protein product [Strongylus vulgaris]